MEDDFDDMSFLDDKSLLQAEEKAIEKSKGGGEMVEANDDCEGGACKI